MARVFPKSRAKLLISISSSKKEGKSPSSILTNQDIYIICLHDYSDPKELEKVAISKEKKEKYGKAIIAAYNDAFKR